MSINLRAGVTRTYQKTGRQFCAFQFFNLGVCAADIRWDGVSRSRCANIIYLWDYIGISEYGDKKLLSDVFLFVLVFVLEFELEVNI